MTFPRDAHRARTARRGIGRRRATAAARVAHVRVCVPGGAAASGNPPAKGEWRRPVTTTTTATEPPLGERAAGHLRTLPTPPSSSSSPSFLVFARFGMDLTTTATVPPAVTYQRKKKKRNAHTRGKRAVSTHPHPPPPQEQTSEYCQDLRICSSTRYRGTTRCFGNAHLSPRRARRPREVAEREELRPHSNTPLFL